MHSGIFDNRLKGMAAERDLRAMTRGLWAVGLTILLAMPCVETLLPPQSPALSGAASRRGPSVNGACRERRLASSMAAVLVAGGSVEQAAPQDRPVDFWERLCRARHHLLAGAMGRFVSVNIMFPVDTIKTRLQMQGMGQGSAGGMSSGAAMTVLVSCAARSRSPERPMPACLAFCNLFMSPSRQTSPNLRHADLPRAFSPKPAAEMVEMNSPLSDASFPDVPRACAVQSKMSWQHMIRPPLFKGVQTALIGQVPNGMLVYGSYEIYKRDLHDRFPAMNPDQVCVCVCMDTRTHTLAHLLTISYTLTHTQCSVGAYTQTQTHTQLHKS